MENKEVKEIPSSGKKATIEGDHAKEVSESISSLGSSEEDFFQLEESELGSSSRTLGSQKENMKVLPEPMERINLDQIVNADNGSKNSSDINSDNVQHMTDNRSNGDDEVPVSIQAEKTLNETPSTSGTSSASASPLDGNAENRALNDFKAEGGDVAIEVNEGKSNLIQSELSPEANHSIVEYSYVSQADGGSSYLGFARQSLMRQAIHEAETYDPGRIPLSVFSRHRSSKDVDWSVASNESMFSIQVGSLSFSGDHVFNFGKSGELNGLISGPGQGIAPEKDSILGDQSSVICADQSADICADQSATSVAILQEAVDGDPAPEKTSLIVAQRPETQDDPSSPHTAILQEKIVGPGGSLPAAVAAIPRTTSMSRHRDADSRSPHAAILQEKVVEAGGSVPTTLAVPRTMSMSHPSDASVPRTTSTSRPSDASGTSNQSFAFPILVPRSNSASLKAQDEPPVPPPPLPQVKSMRHSNWWCCLACSCPSCY